MTTANPSTRRKGLFNGPSERGARSENGFARADLVASLAIVLVLFLWVLPLLGQNKAQSELLGCFNNLRLIGQAVRLWGNEHYDWTPWRTPCAQGGTYPDGSSSSPFGSGPKPGVAWYEMLSLSNHLASPRFLVCPSDEAKRVAGNWRIDDPAQGFVHPSFRNNALSYFVGLETIPWWSRSIVSGDRNLRYETLATGCSARVNNAAAIVTPRLPADNGIANWTNAIHGELGHLLFNDGSVERCSKETFRKTLQTPDDNGWIHFLSPR